MKAYIPLESIKIQKLEARLAITQIHKEIERKLDQIYKTPLKN